ncbi:DUF4279 domain-containing protein [Caldalkalibacillus salinus]|uniref:DUF4279 domain-containing protein n=1 Tax=Caldalkalibacillus salinus TaxID=2803787 RepID=UPI0019232C31|nr:DUF4279 domain-containing protein [Caldalkalibacillus salinus]
MEKTNTYTYFGITSNGEIDHRGLVANENGIFNTDEITELLGIQPFKCWNYGDIRRNGSKYLFSNWGAEKSDIERLDVEAQCMDTIKNLKNKIPQLKQIKEQYDVEFAIMIVPSIYGDEKPLMSFNVEIIEFCYLTGTTIEIDMYLYPNEE